MNSPSAFQFQKFVIKQEHCAMKIGIDSVLLGAWCPINDAKTILDVGSGTGILALMLAQRSDAKIDAIEIEKDAFQEGCENITNSRFCHQIATFHSSLQDFEARKSYDLIISNPPYFDGTLLSENKSRNTARHQTSLNYDDFIKYCANLLSPTGRLVFILPSIASAEIFALAEKHQLSVKNETHVYGKQGKEAKRCLFILQKTPCHNEESHITIRNNDNRYSQEFQELTRAFYLPSIFR